MYLVIHKIGTRYLLSCNTILKVCSSTSFLQYVIVTVCIKAGLETNTWTWVRDNFDLHSPIISKCDLFGKIKNILPLFSNTWLQVTHLAIWGSILSWIIFLGGYSYVWHIVDLAPEMFGMVRNLLMQYFVISRFSLIMFIDHLLDRRNRKFDKKNAWN